MSSKVPSSAAGTVVSRVTLLVSQTGDPGDPSGELVLIICARVVNGGWFPYGMIPGGHEKLLMLRLVEGPF
jgi:hypothetical protein